MGIGFFNLNFNSQYLWMLFRLNNIKDDFSWLRSGKELLEGFTKQFEYLEAFNLDVNEDKKMRQTKVNNAYLNYVNKKLIYSVWLSIVRS